MRTYEEVIAHLNSCVDYWIKQAESIDDFDFIGLADVYARLNELDGILKFIEGGD